LTPAIGANFPQIEQIDASKASTSAEISGKFALITGNDYLWMIGLPLLLS
jgi:hypothetical protein